MASSFEFFKHWQWVCEIAQEEQSNVRPHLLSRDTSVVMPDLGGDLLMTLKLTNNLAYVMTRFEAYEYQTASNFPVQGVFDNATTFTIGVGTAAGVIKTPNIGTSLANAISNIDLVTVFQGGDNPSNQQAIFQVLSASGPKTVNIVSTAYLWRIPGGKAAKFQPYTTIFV